MQSGMALEVLVPNQYPRDMHYRLQILFFFLIPVAAQAQLGMAELPAAASFEQQLARLEENQLQDRIAAFRAAADISGCEGCVALLDQVDDLERAQTNFRTDMQRGMEDMLSKAENDTLLMGRYDLQKLFLPFRDYVGQEDLVLGKEENGNADREIGLMGLEPGPVAIGDIQQFGVILDGHVRYRMTVALTELEGKLDDALPKPVAVVPTALNLLYSGVDNPVKVWAGNAVPSSVELIGPNVEATDEPGVFTVRPDEPGTLELEVKGKTPGGGDVNGVATFQVRRVPKPKIIVAGRDDGILVKNDVSGTSGIVARNDDFLYTVGYKVMGFEMVFTPEYGSPVTINTAGNAFNDKMRNVLKGTRRGDRLLFRVRVEYPDGNARTMSSTFYVR